MFIVRRQRERCIYSSPASIIIPQPVLRLRQVEVSVPVDVYCHNTLTHCIGCNISDSPRLINRIGGHCQQFHRSFTGFRTIPDQCDLNICDIVKVACSNTREKHVIVCRSGWKPRCLRNVGANNEISFSVILCPGQLRAQIRSLGPYDVEIAIAIQVVNKKQIV